MQSQNPSQISDEKFIIVKVKCCDFERLSKIVATYDKNRKKTGLRQNMDKEGNVIVRQRTKPKAKDVILEDVTSQYVPLTSIVRPEMVSFVPPSLAPVKPVSALSPSRSQLDSSSLPKILS